MLNSKEHFLVAAKQHKELRHSLDMQRQSSDSGGSDDTHATLAEEQQDDLHEVDMDLKTPTIPRRQFSEDVDAAFQPSGPMSQLLHSLLMRVADVERAQPTVMAEQYDVVDNLMWANDYPHHEGSWPFSAQSIERQMGGLSDESRAKILGLNAKRVFEL